MPEDILNLMAVTHLKTVRKRVIFTAVKSPLFFFLKTAHKHLGTEETS